MPNASYPSDVHNLSDQELEVLSEELQEAYERCGSEDSYWTDDDAEDRYREMYWEQRRRWELNNPEEAERRKKDPFNIMIRQMSLHALELQNNLMSQVHYEHELVSGYKIGDTITVRKPVRFCK